MIGRDESHRGHTEAIDRAVAAGFGPDDRIPTYDEPRR
jgi:hypothetical protein